MSDEFNLGAAMLDAVEDFGEPVDDRELAFLPRNDLGNARRLLKRFGPNFREVPSIGVHVFTGKRWELDQSTALLRIMGQRTALAIGKREADAIADDDTIKDREEIAKSLRGFGGATCMSAKITAMVNEALPHAQARLEDWNARPEIFNCRNTALELTSGGVKVVAHNRAHLVTRMAGVDYDPAATCPKFEEWLETMQPDPEQRKFVQRSLGSCLTDSASDQAVIVYHGGGANGKSTILEIVCEVLGDYAVTAAVESLLYGGEKQGSAASPDIARLAERPRLVRASEPEPGARLSESHVKAVTGGEPIVARKLHKEPFEFRPNFKIILSCNNRPSIRGGDDGIWRRIMLVSWPVQIPLEQRDNSLKDKLLKEAPGILNWLIRGWEDWMEQGLAPPASVLDATNQYRQDSDALGRFIFEWCERGEGVECEVRELHRAFEIWCKAEGSRAPNANFFSRRLTDRGFGRRKSSGKTLCMGLQLSAQGKQAMEDEDIRQLNTSYRKARGSDDDE